MPKPPQLQVFWRGSSRESRSTILDDYVIYLQEYNFDIGLKSDPTSFQQVKQCPNAERRIESMKEKMKYMVDNDTWKLVKE